MPDISGITPEDGEAMHAAAGTRFAVTDIVTLPSGRKLSGWEMQALATIGAADRPRSAPPGARVIGATAAEIEASEIGDLFSFGTSDGLRSERHQPHITTPMATAGYGPYEPAARRRLRQGRERAASVRKARGELLRDRAITTTWVFIVLLNLTGAAGAVARGSWLASAFCVLAFVGLPWIWWLLIRPGMKKARTIIRDARIAELEEELGFS